MASPTEEGATDQAVELLKFAGWYEDADRNLIRPIPEQTWGFSVQVTGYGDDTEADATAFLFRTLARSQPAWHRITVQVNGEHVWPPR
jgi:hypothetical protein